MVIECFPSNAGPKKRARRHVVDHVKLRNQWLKLRNTHTVPNLNLGSWNRRFCSYLSLRLPSSYKIWICRAGIIIYKWRIFNCHVWLPAGKHSNVRSTQHRTSMLQEKCYNSSFIRLVLQPSPNPRDMLFHAAPATCQQLYDHQVSSHFMVGRCGDWRCNLPSKMAASGKSDISSHLGKTSKLVNRCSISTGDRFHWMILDGFQITINHISSHSPDMH